MKYSVTITFEISPPDGQELTGKDIRKEIDWVFPWAYHLVKWEKVPPP